MSAIHSACTSRAARVPFAPRACRPPMRAQAEYRPHRRRRPRPMNMFEPWFSADGSSPGDALLEALGSTSSATQRFGMRRMLIDVVEDDDQFQIKADVPGIDKNDIRVSVDGDALTLSVEHTSTTEETITDGPESESAGEGEAAAVDGKVEKSSRVLHRQERTFEYDNRVVRMPDSADMEQVDAQCADGVLTVTIPKKSHAVAKRRTVPVA